MAQWEKIKSRGRVDDRRAQGQTATGIGITGILLIMGITYALGGNPIDVLQQVEPVDLIQQQTISDEELAQFEGVDEYETFTATVLGSTNDFWNRAFRNGGKTYQDPGVVLFRGGTQSACGGASTLSGPHYCPADQTIYLDERFFADLKTKFGAQGGDVAEAYVLAHEVGHHVQQQLGALRNRDSVAIELQADCYAGMWAGSLKGQGIFEKNEILEAMDAAAAVGDDNIQSRTSGHVHPESWTHGSSEQRVEAFTNGYEQVSFESCQKYL